ncbi:MAG TPA: hypothetical protein VIQ22_06750, partial [Gammaproteobacteria bacterium]
MNQQDHSTERLHLLPWGDDPLQAIARTLLHEHRNCLPRLEHVTVLLPELSAAPRLRQLLLAQAAELGHTALLGPQIDSWRGWLKRYDIDRLTTVSDYRRELILL